MLAAVPWQRRNSSIIIKVCEGGVDVSCGLLLTRAPEMLCYSEGWSHKNLFLKNIHMPALISLAALNYQHPRGFLSFFLEVQLFSFSSFPALDSQQDSGGLEPPFQGGVPKAAVAPSFSHWPSCFPLQCPIPGALLCCHHICK